MFMSKITLDARRNTSQAYKRWVVKCVEKGLESLVTSSETSVMVVIPLPDACPTVKDVYTVVGEVGRELELAGYEFGCSIDSSTYGVIFSIRI